MMIGWATMPIGPDGNPADHHTGWKASCFVFLFWAVYVGKVDRDP